MAESSVVGLLRVLLTADTAEFDAAMKRVSTGAKAWSKDLGSIGRQATAAGATLTKALTLPLLGVAGGASKLAIDFESSFAGIRKTVQATETEFAQMSTAFRNLAKDIPLSVNELNRLGEAAGALGIPKEEIVDFARVMGLVGETTNLTADQAAESIAKIQNIFGAAGQDTERFASTLVALGNDGASTEAQILEMATRIAGAGNVIGLTQGQVLGFASALASVGLEAEAGGTAISRVFINMAAAVSGGGKELDQFAKVAGVSAQQFAERFRTDAAGAVVAFIEGLGRIKTEGGDLLGVLAEMDIKEIRLRDTLLRAAGAGDLLKNAITLQAQAWRDNSALTEEARKRFETTEAQLTLLWNRLKDVGITLGNALLPVIQSTIGAIDTLLPVVQMLAGAFAAAPAPIQLTILGLGGIAAAAGPVLIVFGQMALGAKTLVDLFTAKGLAARALATAFSGPGGLVVALGATAVAMEALERSTRSSFDALREGEASWKDLPALIGNAIARGLNPFGAAFRDISDILTRFPGEFAQFKTAIVALAQQVYEGVKTWLVTRFGEIVDGIKAKIGAITGAFKDLYDKVIGNSYIPDLVAGIQREFGRLDEVMVEPTRTSTTETAGLFAGLRDATSRIFSQLADNLTWTFGQMMTGAISFRDGFLNLWESLKMSLANIFTQILNDFLNRMLGGMLNGLLSRQGALQGAFAGLVPIGGGGIPGVPGGGGIPGMTLPGWAAGGVAGGMVGGMVGNWVGGATGNRWGGVGAGAGSGALTGALVGGPIGAAIGGLIGGIAGWIGAKRANMKANDIRDQFIGQWGPSGTGAGSGFSTLAGKLHEATGSGDLFNRLIKANDPKELQEAIEAVNRALAEYQQRTVAATTAEQQQQTEIHSTKEALLQKTQVLRDQMQSLDDELAQLEASEKPEKHMGTVEKRTRARIAAQKALLEAQLAEIQRSGQTALETLVQVSDDTFRAMVIDARQAAGDIERALEGRTIRIPVKLQMPEMPDLGGVPGHATGGVFARPHLAAIAEGGQAEIVGSVDFMAQALEGALGKTGGLGNSRAILAALRSIERAVTASRDTTVQIDGREVVRASVRALDQNPSGILTDMRDVLGVA